MESSGPKKRIARVSASEGEKGLFLTLGKDPEGVVLCSNHRVVFQTQQGVLTDEHGHGEQWTLKDGCRMLTMTFLYTGSEEVMDLKAIAEGPAQGIVIESSLEKGRGAVATVLVQAGTLKQGDMLIAGEEYGRVRNMFDESQQSITEAGPSTPVVVLGLSKTPGSGDDFIVVKNERKAREVAEFRQAKSREAKLAQQLSPTTLS